MHETSPDYETVLKTSQRKECRDARLVLEAVGIASQVFHEGGSWYLVVGQEDLEASKKELQDYREENPDRSVGRVVASTPTYPFAVAGVFIYTAVVVLIAVQSAQFAFRFDWVAAGRMEASAVKAGELWRTVTALTLHADVGHLASNVVFGTVFGLLVGRLMGGGVAWLVIVVAGALGNFINALVRSGEHMSIGASTAVFAALGVLVAHALRPAKSFDEKPLKRWSPLIGGVVLLGFIGVGGERTDVGAHVAGFISGLLIGWLACRLPTQWLESSRVQQAAGLASLGIVTVAWAIALAVVG